MYVPIWCCKQITSKRNVHRPTILNSLSAGDGRLHRIVLFLGCPRTITDISVFRLSLIWCVPGNTTRHRHVSRLRLLTFFFRPCCFSCTFASLGTPFDATGRMGPSLYGTRTTTCESCQSNDAEPHRALHCSFFPDVTVVFQQTTNVMWEQYLLSHVRATITTPDLTNAVARITLSLATGHCSVKPSPFHPNLEAVTFLVHIFAEIERLTNTRQRTHHKPPLSSSTPSADPATFSTSLTPPSRLCRSSLHLHTKVLHLQGEFTSWVDALGLHTETPHTARVPVSDFRRIRQRRESFSHGRTSRCGEARRDLPEMGRPSSDHLD